MHCIYLNCFNTIDSEEDTVKERRGRCEADKGGKKRKEKEKEERAKRKNKEERV
jgi:hypothetical protein